MLASSTTTQPTPVRIVIADDHPCMIDGIRFALRKYKQVQIVGDALNGEELLKKVQQLQPDVVLTDIEMPLMNGIEAGRQIRERFPHIKLVAFSGFDSYDYITSIMLELKASGYLLKGATGKEIMKAIDKAMSGEIYCSEEVSAKLLKLAQQMDTNFTKPQSKPVFTERQTLIMIETANGLSCKDIALKHNLPLGSVQSGKKELCKKTGCRNSAELTLYSVRNQYTRV